MTLNCKKCGKIKEHMVAYIPYKNGNVTGMICSDCKNKEGRLKEFGLHIEDIKGTPIKIHLPKQKAKMKYKDGDTLEVSYELMVG